MTPSNNNTIRTRNFICAILVIGWSFMGNSQQTWVSENAMWTYLYTNIAEEGYIEVSETNDSIINGINCKEYSCEIFRHGMNSSSELIFLNSEVYRKEYVYANQDTVFVLNEGVFVPMYIFNAPNNSTYEGPIDSQNTVCNNNSLVSVTDSTQVTINSTNYIQQRLSNDDFNSFKIRGVVNSRFGHFDTLMAQYNFIFPSKSNCDSGLDHSHFYQFSCFEDNDISYSANSDACIYPYNTLSLLDNEIAHLSIYPNPSNGDFVTISSDQAIQSIEIYDVLGPLVYLKNGVLKKSFPLNVTELSNEIYFVRITDVSNRVYFRKIIRN